MTIAINAKGAVLGQVVASPDPYKVRGWVRILTRDGYKDVPRSSVRLEELR